MSATPSKVRHVLRAGQTRDHTCHWPGCGKQVPPAMWGCRGHWYALPKALRDEIWRTYRPGQETTLTPSPAYLAAARKVQDWIKENGKQMSDRTEARLQQISLAHDELHKGNVEQAHEAIHRALGIEDLVADPNSPKFFREFDIAFNTACRKNQVLAAYIIFDHDDPANPRKVRILTGGHEQTCGLLKLLVEAGQAALAK